MTGNAPPRLDSENAGVNAVTLANNARLSLSFQGGLEALRQELTELASSGYQAGRQAGGDGELRAWVEREVVQLKLQQSKHLEGAFPTLSMKLVPVFR